MIDKFNPIQAIIKARQSHNIGASWRLRKGVVVGSGDEGCDIGTQWKGELGRCFEAPELDAFNNLIALIVSHSQILLDIFCLERFIRQD